MRELRELEMQRLALQRRFDQAKTASDRNRFGQFATPPKLAEEILRLARAELPSHEKVRFLDPAFGTGSFFSALLRVFGPTRVAAAEGFEVDQELATPSLALWRSMGLRLNLKDFTTAQPPKSGELFNLIICNPPYVRHHHLRPPEKRRLRKMSEACSGLRLGGLAGLYGYFLLLAHAWMAEEALAVWLIPNEFMDVNYGVPLRRYLASKVRLLRVHRFAPEDVQFSDALVSSSVVCFRRSAPEQKERVIFSIGGTLAEPKISSAIRIVALRPEVKWNNCLNQKPTEKFREVTISDFFETKRGLATGDNNFFILSKEEITKHRLPMRFFRPILPSPRYVKCDEILADENGDPLLQRQLFLLDCSLKEQDAREQYPTLWEYLESGKPSVSGRYLCKTRLPWYSQENRPAATFLCTYMGRSSPRGGKPFRFLLNRSRATAANVYLMLYPKPALTRALDANKGLAAEILKVLNQLSPKALCLEGRVYGGGLYKLEPRELGNVAAGGIARLLGWPSQRTGVQLDLLSARDESGANDESPVLNPSS